MDSAFAFIDGFGPGKIAHRATVILAVVLCACGGADEERCDPLAPRLQLLDGGDAGDRFSDRVEIEYLARTEQDELLLVVRPAEDWSYDDFRLFLGPLEHMRERDVQQVRRQRDGGTTNILFELGGKTADAFFPVQFVDGRFEPGPATLTVDGEAAPLTRLDPGEQRDLLERAEFFCPS
jgi:hypothetical protein